MKGEVIAIDHFLAINKRFNIPIYQRAYSWGEEECRQLFFDIERTKGKISHFFGSLVVVPDSNGLVVIDGQQRLTTISLLLLALKCAFSTGKKPSQVHPDDLDSMIYEESGSYAYHCFFRNWKRIKLLSQNKELYSM